MVKELALFLGEMIRNPGDVRAIGPSSGAAARRMTLGLEGTEGPVVEIGPGTGAFTRAILKRGVAPERLTLLETSERFCEELTHTFPGVSVLNRPAQDIGDLGLTGVAAVISGVPLLARPQLQRELLGKAFSVMRPEGFFTQITYSPREIVSAERRAELGLEVEDLGMVWANLPPAQVYRFRAARPH
ncbi:methyltransferase type 12 [Maritimibacter sp. 55A14]|uniref:class I SAM-dependent methyltransferase n=1 Tax=Maritimibacter sp. 55A14 TaxID=2174844 RepID=UPI000D608A72|nr:rRNA adenine N-6-methyltransferase family protein [Maritimibacter sp. 55A14]PWE30680.1 methyltransferase type 12 [Maritimibacter sp. 55A14]